MLYSTTVERQRPLKLDLLNPAQELLNLTHRNNGLKYFRFWFRFRRDIQILASKKLTPHSIKLCGALKKYKYLDENKTKKENILTHLQWLRPVRMMKKTEGRKSRWTGHLRNKSR